MKLKVIAPDVTWRTTRVYLDDKELTQVTKLEVTLEAGYLNRAVLEFVPTELELEGEFDVEKQGETEDA